MPMLCCLRVTKADLVADPGRDGTGGHPNSMSVDTNASRELEQMNLHLGAQEAMIC